MGILRLILALAVVLTHSSPIFGWTSVGGAIAVQAFYIISGFYMALILSEKYIGINSSYKLFITNRLLRLYPTFWAVLLLTFAASIAGYYAVGNGLKLQPYIDNYHNMGITSLLFLIVANIALVGQDIVMFLGLDSSTGALFFTSNFRLTSPQLYKFLLVPQAWTIGVEIAFYIVAPFLIKRRSSILWLLIIASITLRLGLYYFLELHNDPWTYRFIPTEMALFLVGILSYRFYASMKKRTIEKSHIHIAFVFLICYTLLFQYIPIPLLYKQIAYYVAIALLIPLIFMLTKKSKTDMTIGELSYPVYISHYLVIQLLRFIFQAVHIHEAYLGITSVIGSLAFSFLLIRYVITPIERIRQARVQRA